MTPRQRIFKKIYKTIRKRGLNIGNVKNALRYYRDFIEFSKDSGNSNPHILPIKRPFPIWDDFDSSQTPLIDVHYFLQDWYVAKKILANSPERHVDVGSRIDGFVSHLAVFREVEVFDIRPFETPISNIKFIQKDLMQLDPTLSGYTESLSCLHVIEHFGLGRYNDEIDPLGHVKGIAALTNLLKTGGKFYFSVPLGDQRVEFNAHRVFSLDYLVNNLLSEFMVDELSYIDDSGEFHCNVSITDDLMELTSRLNFGLGIFELIKK